MTTETLAARIAGIMGSIGGVEKKGKITSQAGGPQYKFARDSDVLLAVIPKLAEAGIVMVPEHVALLSVEPNMRGTQQIATVRTQWLVTDGKEELRFESLGMGQDSGDKSLPKAQTNARKYGLFMLLHIVTGDDPDEWASAPVEQPSAPVRATVRPEAGVVPPRAPAPAETEQRKLKNSILEAALAHGWSADRVYALGDQVGVPKGADATVPQLEAMLDLIEQPESGEQASAREASPATTPALAPDEAGQPSVGEVPPSQPAGDTADPASTFFGEQVAAATGGELLLENPAASAIAKAKARAAAQKVTA